MDIATGFLLGVAVVAPVGPVSLLLVALGLERGRGEAVRAGLGIAAADVLLIIAMLACSSQIAALGPAWQQSIHVVIGVGLLTVAGHGLMSRTGMGAVVLRIHRPFRALLMATLLNPMTLTVWLGVAVIIGTNTSGLVALVLHGAGLVLATVLWHTGLGTLAASLGTRVGTRGRLRLQRLSSAALLAMSIVLLA